MGPLPLEAVQWLPAAERKLPVGGFAIPGGGCRTGIIVGVTVSKPPGARRPGSRVTGESNPRRILAIDYGRRKIGLALSDELGLTARPLANIPRVNRRTDLKRLGQICKENSVGRVIVGHPLHLSGETGEMADEAARFAGRLRKETGIETELVDERLTSWQAQQLAGETSSKRRKGGPLDDLAAAILLREYLERRDPNTRATTTETH
jgi:putative holliday junction resolvase